VIIYFIIQRELGHKSKLVQSWKYLTKIKYKSLRLSTYIFIYFLYTIVMAKFIGGHKSGVLDFAVDRPNLELAKGAHQENWERKF